MNIREISDVFRDTASGMTAIKSYNFGWASDRVRHGNTEDYQDLNAFPRLFFSVPTITSSDQTRKQDTYQVTLFFDDLLGYDNEGDSDLTLQIDKWAALQEYATAFIQRLNLIKQSILPNYLFIPDAPSFTFDSFVGIQRLVTVQVNFNLVVPTNCDIALTKLVECIANITTSTQLEASLTTVLKFAANLEARATLTADINFVHKVQASLTGAGTTAANLTVGSSVDADAQAFFNQVTTAGGTLTTTEQNAVNTLVVQMKADGIWTKMKAIYPMVGGTSSTHRWNLKDPRDLNAAFRLVFASGGVHSSTGYLPNGVTGYADTFLIPNGLIGQNSAHLSFYSRTNSLGNGMNIGAIDITTPFRGLHMAISFGLNSNQMRTRCNSTNASTSYTPTDTRGLFLISRIISTEYKGYKNNASVFTFSEVSNLPTSIKIVIGAINTTSGVDNYSTNECAFASIGDGLTDTEVANFYTAVQAFQTTLNRQV